MVILNPKRFVTSEENSERNTERLELLDNEEYPNWIDE